MKYLRGSWLCCDVQAEERVPGRIPLREGMCDGGKVFAHAKIVAGTMRLNDETEASQPESSVEPESGVA